MLNLKKIRKDFPILSRKINGKKLVYFDSGATSQKPKFVLDTIKNFYETSNANVHRGVHKLAEESTIAYEKAREKVAKFINAKPEEIIFTKNTTESLNFAIFGYGMTLKEGDQVLTTKMEHHSNIVPWQQLSKMKKLKLNYVDFDNDGLLKQNEFKKHLENGTKFFGVVHASNVLGTINPIKEMIKKAHDNDAVVVVDAAQSAPHMPIDVKDLDVDFLTFSGHKMLAPFGIGVLYGKKELLETIEPHTVGSEMIKEVHLDHSTWNDLPWKFEYGTNNVEGAIALGAAVDYLNKIGMKNVRKHDVELTKYALEKLAKIKKLTIYGPKDARKRAGLVAFNLGDIHPHDLATILDQEGIAVRSGHHCAMPLHTRLGISASTRASFYLYNTLEEVDLLVKALEKATKIFRL